MNRLIADTLLDLEDYQGLDIYHEQRNSVAKISYLAFQAYDCLGYDLMKTLKFRKAAIIKALNKLDVDELKDSFPIISRVYTEFRLNIKYTWFDIKIALNAIFTEFRTDYNAKAKDIERYFEFKSTKKDDDRAYIFTSRKFFQVDQKRHV
ncbi:MAG TPA: hypothetical protein VK668_10395 [Mucilaginibacter sp.]|nr:hypothetical protein [Mucilaginibacter sp.]